MTETSTPFTKIDLAQEADFVLGGLQISPSVCRATAGDSEERVEPRVMEVLIVLVRNEGRTVTREQLIEACWGGRAVSDDAVTRVIARLRALGRNADPPHFTLETVPKVGFRLVAGAAAAEPVAPAHRALVPRLAAAALAMTLLAGFGVWLATADRGQRANTPAALTVAVAPFGTLGPQTELVGLAKKTQEAAVRRLIGAGFPSAMISPIGAAPDHFDLQLHGDVEVVDNTYAVRARLGYPNETALWSVRFERKTDDLLGLDEEIAFAVAESLTCAFRDYAAAPPRVREALLPLLLEHCRAINAGDHEGAVIAGRRLVAAAPGLSAAHGRLALALAEQATRFVHLSEQEDALADQARKTAYGALAMNANDIAAHIALGIRSKKGNYIERERHFNRALELDPHNASALSHYAAFLREVGRVGAAREILDRLERSPSTSILRAFMDAMNGNPVNADRQLEQVAIVRPHWAREGRWIIAAFWEDPKAAVHKLPALGAAAQKSNAPCLLAYVTALARNDDRPQTGLPAGCDKLPDDWRVRLLARQGDVAGAFALLNREWPTARTTWFLFYPEMKSVRADSRFKSLAERWGLLAYWRETGHWPDFCAEPDLPYDCSANL